MSLPIVILTLMLVGLVVLVLSAPLRAASRARAHPPAVERSSLSGGAPAPGSILARDELEAAREAKYREIRDTELDYRTGKLSREDYEAIDAELRAEAIEILNRLEQSAGPGLAQSAGPGLEPSDRPAAREACQPPGAGE
ncbi:MAG TPA: hypothetical protein VK252_04330 [Solirubrobacteraceae bacterium]|nr:hypothetical protein [Solirubrobacteraceae bacterium]